MKFTNGYWLLRDEMKAAYAVEYGSHRVYGQELTMYLPCSHIVDRGSCLNIPLLTVTLSSPMDGVIKVSAVHHDGAVYNGPFAKIYTGDAHVRIEENEEQLIYQTGSLKAVIDKAPSGYKMAFYEGYTFLTESSFRNLAYMQDTKTGKNYMLEQMFLDVAEYVYGFGERFTPFVKNGQVVEMWNEDGGTASEIAYKNIPFYVTNKGYGILVDNEGDVAYEIASEKVEKFPIVLKADGLALGKGVLICNTLEEAKDGVKEIMEDKKFGSAGNTMVIEEFMTGREVSVLTYVDGKTIKPMTSAQDHKRAKDGDQGLNTGGMGTFSPSPFYTEEVDAFCKAHIYQATVDAMAAEGREFKGIIFFGLMLTADGPKVLEYNARFGDPEAQVVLPRMKTDIVDVFEACIDGTLDQIDLEFEDNAAVCVVLASDGYPVSYQKGFPIKGLDAFKEKEGYYVFHAGTAKKDGQIVTNGGRVLGVVAKGDDLKQARANAYKAIDLVEFDNKYYRHDIGKAIDEA